MEYEHIIVGGGGHALALADALLAGNQRVLGYTDPTDQGGLGKVCPWLGDDRALQTHKSPQLRLLNGLGSVGTGIQARRELFIRLESQDFVFASLTHPHASISTLDTEFANGLAVLAGARIGPGVRIGQNVLINSGAVIEHGCKLGSHCHVASRALLCGDVSLGDAVHIGAGACVVQGVSIGAGAVIAAGAVVTQNVEPLTLVAGVPARMKRKLEP